MLTSEQVRQFEEVGFFRLESAFSRTAAAAMEACVWRALGDDVRPDRPESWPSEPPSGLQPARDDPAFSAIGSPAVTAALDGLLGTGAWRRPRHWGQMLVSFPRGTPPWNVPSGVWHTDFGFDGAVDPLPGALVLSYLSDVPERGGGTLAVRGSPSLVRRFVTTCSAEQRSRMARVRRALYRSDPWLEALTSDSDDDRIERFMSRTQRVAETELRVVELTGRAGDVVLAHPWLLHTSAPNVGARPRMSCVQRIHRR